MTEDCKTCQLCLSCVPCDDAYAKIRFVFPVDYECLLENKEFPNKCEEDYVLYQDYIG